MDTSTRAVSLGLTLGLLAVTGSRAEKAAVTPDLPVIRVRKEIVRQFRIVDRTIKALPIERTLTLPGVIQPDETKLVRITTVASGRVRQVMVFPGDHVERLQQLALIDSAELAERKSAYLQALSRAELARRMLDNEQEWAKLEVDARKPFEDAKGAALAAKNAYQVARTQLEAAERRFRAEESLYEDGITARQALEEVRSNYVRFRSELERARADLELADGRLERERSAYQKKILPQRELQQAQANLDLREIELEGARTSLSIYGIETTTSALDLQKEYVKKNPVVTPLTGMVIRQNVRVGDVVQPDRHLFEVADLSTVWFVADLPERDRREVQVGDPLSLEVASHGDLRFEGKIMRVSPLIDATTRTVPCIGYLYNPKGQLLPGMTARARVVIEEPRLRLLVERRAIQDFRGETVVFVRLEDENEEQVGYQLRRVKLGPEFDLAETPDREHLVEVVAGLEPGMRVVGEGAFSLLAEFFKRGGGAE